MTYFLNRTKSWITVLFLAFVSLTSSVSGAEASITVNAVTNTLYGTKLADCFEATTVPTAGTITVTDAMGNVLPDDTVLSVGNYKLTFTFNPASDAFEPVSEVKNIQISRRYLKTGEATLICNIPDEGYIYDGVAKTPAVEVRATINGEEVVIPADEYKVAYYSNLNANTSARVVVDDDATTGNIFIPYLDKSFTIAKRVIEMRSASQTWYEDGEVHTNHNVQITSGEFVDGEGIDHYEFYNSIQYAGSQNNSFHYSLKDNTSEGNYTFVKTEGELRMLAADAEINDYDIVIEDDNFTYNGSEIRPEVTVKIGDQVLKTSEYELGFENNINAGTATLTVTDAAGGYFILGRKSKLFSINKATISDIFSAVEDKVYDGNSTAKVTVSGFKGAAPTDDKSNINITATAEFNDKNVGKDKVVTITYELTGSSVDNYQLADDTETQKADITTKKLDVIWGSTTEFIYDGTEKSIEASLNGVLSDDVVNMTFGGTTAATAAGVYTANVSGLDNDNYELSGPFSLDWKIDEKYISDYTVSFVDPTDGIVYNGSAQKPAVLVKVGEEVIDASEYTLTYKDNVKAGIATVEVRDAEGGNYNLSENAVTFSIAKADISVDEVAVDDKDYDGKDDAVAKIIKSTGKIGSDDVTITVLAKFADQNAGADKDVLLEYSLSGLDADNYQLTKNSDSKIATINKLRISLDWGTTVFDYDGADKYVSATVKGAVNGDDVNVAIYTGNTHATEAGTYTVNAVALDNSNYELPGHASTEWQIKSNAIEDYTVILNIPAEGYTYDHTAKKPSVVVKVGDDVVPASEYTVAYLDNTKAGTARVVIDDAPDGTYRFAEKEVEFNIAQKPLTVSWPTTEFVYTGSGKSISATLVGVVSGDVVEPKYSGTRTASNAGEYKVSVSNLSGSSSANYVLSGNTSVVWRIKKMQNDADAWLENEIAVDDYQVILTPADGFVYNGSAHKPVVKIMNADTVVPTSEYEVTYNNNVDAGTASITITDAVDGEYKMKDTVLTFTIEKADIYAISAMAESKVYDGNAEVKVIVDASAGAVDGDDVKISASGMLDNANVGTAKPVDADFYLEGKAAGNYNLVVSVADLKANVLAREVAVDWGNTSFLYNGLEKEVKPTLSNIVTGDVVNMTISGNKQSAVGNYVATIESLDNNNYKLPTKTTTDWTISSRAVGKNDFLLGEIAFTYNGEPQAPEITCKEGLVEGTDFKIEYTNGGEWTAVKPTNADAYEARVVIINENYGKNAVIDGFMFSIAKATVSITDVVANDKVYDGTRTAVVEYSTSGIIDGDLADVTVNVAGEFKKKGVGENITVGVTASLTGTKADNYKVQLASNTVVASISPKEVTLEWSETEFDFDGTTKTVTATVGGVVPSEVVKVSSYKDNSSAAVGNYTAVAVSLSDPNYKLPANASVAWSIKGVTADDYSVVLTPADGFVYDGLAKTPVVKVMVGEVVVPEEEYSVEYENNTNAGTAKVIVTNVDGNYLLAEKTITFPIAKATITVGNVAVADKVYDGNTDAEVTMTNISGIVASEDNSVIDVVASGEFDDKNVGEDKDVTISYSLTGVGAGNYQLAATSAVKTASITPKTVRLKWSATEFAYDGTEKSVSATVSDVVDDEVVEVTTYTGTVAATAAGSYNATATTLNDGNYKLPAMASLNWKIAEKLISDYTISLVIPTEGYVYDGMAKTPEVSVKVGDEVIPTSEYDVTYEDNVNAGTAKVVVKDINGGNYTVLSQNATFTIAKATITVSETEVDDKVYDGTTDATVKVNEFTGAAVADSKLVVDVVATGSFNDKNVGADKVVDVTYSLTGTGAGNYMLASSTDSKTASITAKVVTLNWGTTSFTFDGTVKEVSATVEGGVDGDDVKVVAYEGTTSATAAGDYSATAATLNNDNYKLPETASVEWNINSKVIDEYSIALTLPADGYVYDGMAKEPAVVVMVGEDVIPAAEYKVTYSENVNAGSAVVAIADVDGGNFKLADNSENFPIAKAVITVSGTNVDDKVYDGTTAATVTMGTFAGAVEGEGSAVIDVTASAAFETKDAGNNKNVNVTYSLIGTGADNYKLKTSTEVLEATIEQKAVTLDWGTTTFVYDGTEKKVAATVAGAVADETVTVKSYSGTTAATAIGNYNASVVALSDNNYKVTEADVEWMIKPIVIPASDLSIAYDNTDTSYIYNGAYVKPEVKVLVAGKELDADEYEISYLNNKNAGTATVVVAPAEGSIYTFETISSEFEIQPREVVLQWSNNYFRYDGSVKHVEAKATNNVAGETVKVSVYTDNVKTDAGEYVATAVELNDANYKLPADASVVWYIIPMTVDSRDIIVKLSENEYVYDGTEHQPAVEVYVVDDKLEADQFNVEYVNNVNAGTASVVITDAKNDNYSFLKKSAVFSIKPKTVGLTWGDDEFDYDGTKKTIKATLTGVLVGDFVSVSSYDENEMTDAGNYIAAALTLSNTNYQLPAEFKHNWKINQKVVGADEAVVVFDDADLIYDGSEKKPGFTVKAGTMEIPAKEYSVVYADNKNAGVAKVTITDVDGGNFDLATLNASFNILQRIAQLNWSKSDFIYDGSEKTITASIANAVEGDDVVVESYDGNAAVVTGRYTAKALALDNANYKLPADATKAWSISAVNVAVDQLLVDIKGAPFTYNGKAQNPTIVVKAGDVVIPSAEYEISIVGNVDAGVAKVSIKDKAYGNYEFTGIDTSFQINPVVINVSSGSKTWVYDGYTHMLDEVTVTGDFVEGEGFDIRAVAEIKNVSTCQNIVSITPNEGTKEKNYKFVTEWGTLEVTPAVIGPIELDPVTGDTVSTDLSKVYAVHILPSSRSFIYSGKAVQPTVILTLNGEQLADSLFKVTYENNVNVGVGKVIISDVEGGNYTLLGCVDSFNITPISISVTACSKTWVYDGAEHKCDDVTIRGAFVKGEGIDCETTGAITEVGSVKNELVVTPKQGTLLSNYRLFTVDGELTVEPLKLSPVVVNPTTGDTVEKGFRTYITVLDYRNYEYIGQALTPAVKIYEKGGALVPATEYTVKYEDNTDAGVASVLISDVEGGNYDLVASTENFTISPISVKVISGSKTWIYDGEEHTYNDVAVLGNFVTGEGFDFKATGAITEVGTVKNTLVITPEEGTKSGNYDFEKLEGKLVVNASVLQPVVVDPESGDSLTIDPVSGDTVKLDNPAVAYMVKLVPATDELFYNGSAHEPVVEVYTNGVKLPSNEYVVRYADNVNAGIAQAVVDNKKGGNYTLVPSTVNFIINPVAISITSASKTWTYDGEEHACADVEVVGRFVNEEGYNIKAVGTITEVGSVKNKLVVTPKAGTRTSNYKLTLSEGDLVIEPVKLEPVIDPVTGDTVEGADPAYLFNVVVNPANDSLYYNGTAQEPVVEVYANGVKISAAEYEVMYENNTDAGEAKVNITDKEGGNYQISPAVAKFNIYPLAVGFTSGSKTWTYDGAEHVYDKVSVTGRFVKDEGFDVKAVGAITEVGSVKNKLQYAPKAGTKAKNYVVSTSEGDLTIEIRRISPAVVVGGDTVVVDPITGDTIWGVHPSLVYSVVVKGDSLYYNGEPREPEVEIYSNGVMLSADEYIVRYANNIDAGMGKVMISEKEGGNYNLDYSVAEFRIYPADATFTSGSKTWTYDGNEHSFDEVRVSGMMKGEAFNVKAVGAITEVGTTKNTISYTAADGTKESNYSISLVEGDLIVEPIKLDPIIIDPETGDTLTIDPVTGDTVKQENLVNVFNVVVNPAGDSLFYNGKPQLPAVEVYSNGVLVSASEYELMYQSNVDAGVAKVLVTDKNGGNYIINPVIETFNIYPVAIRVTSGSKTWIYDGEKHTCSDMTVSGNIIEGEGFDIKVTGAITEVGSVKNSILIVPTAGTKAANYNIKVEEGTLTVKKRTLTPAVIDPVSGDTVTVDPITGDTVSVEDPTDVYLVKVDLSGAPYIYKGSDYRPAVSVFYNDEQIASTEYAVHYFDNINAGKAKIVVTNIPGRFELDDYSTEFDILPIELGVKWDTITSEFMFDSTAHTIRVSLVGVIPGDVVKPFVTGTKATNAGQYVAKVSGVDNSNYTVAPDSIIWTIKKSYGDKPALLPVAESEPNANDGHIIGLNDSMEYKLEGAEEFLPVTDPDMDLAPGKYIVRRAEDENHIPSLEVTVVIPVGKIPFEIQSLDVNANAYCPETEDVIRFSVTGNKKPTAFRIVFDDDAVAAGFDSTEFMAIEEDGVLPISIPDCYAGVYNAKVQFRSAKNYVTDFVSVKLPVNLSTRYMVDIFDDVISAVNVEDRFTAYKWFHNDEELYGVTKPYYCEKGGLTGSYYMEVKTIDNTTLKTCKLYFAEPKVKAALAAYPNPAVNYVNVELTVDNGEEHTLKVYNSAGGAVLSTKFFGKQTVVDMTNLPAGTYVVNVDGLDVKVVKL